MAKAIHFTLSQERLHPAFSALDQVFAYLGQAPQGSAAGTPFRLHVANTLWGQQGFEFLSEFLDTLAENYGAGLRLVDFSSNPEAARQTINQWVSDQMVSLTYESGNFEIVVILPAVGQFEALQANFSPDWLAQALDGRQFQTVHLSLPKFNFNSDFSLVNALSSLGMPHQSRRKFLAKIYLLFIPFLCNFVLK